MSAVKIFLAFIIFALSGCSQKKDITKHGMSNLPTKRSSCMGADERKINLKFNVSKSKINTTATIKALISLPYDYNQPLQYKWKLGEKVVAINKQQISGAIAKLKQNNTLEISIEVDNFNTKENRFVRFEIVGTDPAQRIFTDGIISSQQENSFESIVQEVEKINAQK